MTLRVGTRVKVYGFDSLNYFNEGSNATVTKLGPCSVWVKYDDEDFPEAEIHERQVDPQSFWEHVGWSGAV